ncbi:Membrane protein involved in the export of O-antigen and teichoic acid [Flavobacterium sp. CF108]|uniref:O-antigen translocase n=1 Tax=unclassified Flavobacterium TaxID=196869 RepID=UPI0008BA837D|nr:MULTISPECIES: O-antigen translocase [unclassified Flavobacterium]SEO50167.1 Polysaccharide biosynthesis protein [Flavobacterium sp. fv08]SHH72639.1 Membrane protein involved in the export of O-antigen and teichoic acid [Flavobacterium sp. CF108]
MKEKHSSYQQIFKATSILGSVQVFNIIISVLRSKIVAVLLGPAGMGIVSIFTSTIGLLGQITNLGLGTSAVKNISKASETNDQEKLAKTATVFRKLVWITGLFGFVVALILSPFLSEISFGNKKYTFAFVLLSITLLFTQVSTGQNVILQGMRKIQYMAKASALGALLGLIISIPMYYYWKEDGIVPAMILSSISIVVISSYYVKKIAIPSISVNSSDFKSEGMDMLRMGFLISFSSIILLIVGYIVRIYINKIGGIKDVGLYTAGFAIINTYVGMVFTAMASDYYPRLASVSDDNIKTKKTINEQAEIAILILSPILVVFLVFIHWGIILLYSNDFIEVIPMVHWATLGVFFKALSWTIAFLFLAKGASKVYFWNEVIVNTYMLILNMLGYYYYGLTGLGISFLISYFLYFIQVFFICKIFYEFDFNKEIIKIFSIQFTLALFSFIAVYFCNIYVAYSVGLLIILVSSCFSLNELDKKLDIKGIISNKFKKKF